MKLLILPCSRLRLSQPIRNPPSPPMLVFPLRVARRLPCRPNCWKGRERFISRLRRRVRRRRDFSTKA